MKRTISNKLMMSVLTLAATFLLAGCTPWATYPPIDGAVDMSNPNLEPIPTLMSRAIRYAYEEDGAQGALIYNLPENTPYKVWAKVGESLSMGRPMTSSGEQAYHVTTVRVRTTDAEVDVIHPGLGGTPELMTIKFDQKFGGKWKAESDRRWRIRVEVPPPHYMPPPPDQTPQPESRSAGVEPNGRE